MHAGPYHCIEGIRSDPGYNIMSAVDSTLSFVCIYNSADRIMHFSSAAIGHTPYYMKMLCSWA